MKTEGIHLRLLLSHRGWIVHQVMPLRIQYVILEYLLYGLHTGRPHPATKDSPS